MIIDETFWTLLHDKAHWEFELFLMALFDGLIGAMFWPFISKHWKHHKDRDKRESKAISTLSETNDYPSWLRFTATKDDKVVNAIIVDGPAKGTFRVYEETRSSMRNWDVTNGWIFPSKANALCFLLNSGWTLTFKIGDKNEEQKEEYRTR